MSGRDFWVFAYGSLMWNPGFEHADAVPARLHGYHRRFCAWSFAYRGTPERPGLLLGLDRGGACAGIAFRVAAPERRRVLAYLFERELDNGVADNGVYRPLRVTVQVPGARVRALAFVADRAHPCYAGRVAPADMVAALATGTGNRGTARDYLANTVGRLAALGRPDRRLETLLREVDALRGSRAAGDQGQREWPQAVHRSQPS
ncbi:MAG: gamma-glutamylcyclotransferase [Alphaproteobacteria bacterium]|nr:gamma-glutamylcyclotransferase [Alphaproteobacteria bacterium]